MTRSHAEELPPARRSGAGAGISAPEAIVALLLGLFVIHLGVTTLAQLRASEARLAARSDGLTAMRVAGHVLRRELRRGRPGRDWVVDDDSLRLRAFRGTAIVCACDSATAQITVSYRGDRRPDPSKDSVLLLGPTGSVEVRALVGTGGSATDCGPAPATELESWTLDAPVEPGAVVARLFERGSYHVALSALRYRRGASGRQPLTPEVWGDSSTWSLNGARLGLEVRPLDPDVGLPWAAFLSWTASP